MTSHFSSNIQELLKPDRKGCPIQGWKVNVVKYSFFLLSQLFWTCQGSSRKADFVEGFKLVRGGVILVDKTAFREFMSLESEKLLKGETCMFARRSVAVILLLFLLPFSVMAYQLSPLNVTYDPSGAGSAKVYTIVNDSDAPIAIEVRAEQRIVDIDGNEANQDGSAYFSIQPSRMIIRPDSTQLVRVQYRGPQTVTRELSFRIISEQIAMPRGAQDNESGQMISFLFVYSTSAYVRPSRIVESVASSVTETEEGKLEIVLENTGSVHQMLNNLAITLTGDDGSSYVLSEEELGPLKGQNLLANSRLRTVIDMPDVLSGAGAVTADISYDYTYSS